MSTTFWPGPVDDHFRVSVAQRTIGTEGHDNKKSTPERRCSAIARGPRRHVKGHDRLMHSVQQPADNTPPPPCPTCGSPARSSSLRRQSGAITGDYLCKNGHIWTTRWMEVA